MTTPTRIVRAGAWLSLALLAVACAKVRIQTKVSEGWLWVQNLQPAPNDLTVNPFSAVAIEFKEDLDPRTVTSTSFLLRSKTENVPGIVTYYPTERVAVLEPLQVLSIGTTYEATVTTDVRATDGDPLPEAIAWTFQTTTTLAASSEADRAGILTILDDEGRPLTQRAVRIVAPPR